MEYRYVQNELRFSYLDGDAETRAYKRDLYDITLASHPHSRSFLDDVTTPSWDHILFERQPFVPRHLKTLECVVVIMPIPTRILEQIKKLIPPLNGTLHKGQSGRVGVLGGALEYVIEIFDRNVTDMLNIWHVAILELRFSLPSRPFELYVRLTGTVACNDH